MRPALQLPEYERRIRFNRLTPLARAERYIVEIHGDVKPGNRCVGGTGKVCQEFKHYDGTDGKTYFLVCGVDDRFEDLIFKAKPQSGGMTYHFFLNLGHAGVELRGAKADAWQRPTVRQFSKGLPFNLMDAGGDWSVLSGR